MNIVGKSVIHVKFGKGEIIKQYENKMEVDFGSSVKCFLYPDSFENFFQTSDERTKQYIKKELELYKEVKKKKEYEKEIRMQKKILKNKASSHGVFDIKEEDFTSFTDFWEIYTDNSNKRSLNGKFTVPNKLNMNSACILTMKEKWKKENERKVIGLFMTEEDFIGANCQDGVITAHEKYRILLDCYEPIYFWNFFPEEKRLKSWGSKKMKYTSTITVKEILNKISNADIEDELKEEVIEFDRYFCEENSI